MAPDTFSLLATHLAFFLTGLLLLLLLGFQAGNSKVAIVGYFSHIAVGFLLWNSTFPKGDASTYTMFGRVYSEFLDGGFQKPLLVSGKDGWPILLGNLFHKFGYIPELGIYINATALVIAALVTHKTCEILNIQSNQPIAALIILFSPASLYWGSLPGREPLNWLCISVMVLGAALLLVNRWVQGILSILIAMVSLFPIRGSISVALAFTFLVSFGLTYKPQQIIGKIGRFGAFALALTLLPLAIERLNNQGLNGRSIEKVRSSLAIANSAFINGDSSTTTYHVFSLETLKAIPEILIGPFFWQVRPSFLLAFIDAIFWMVAWYFCYIGIKFTKRYEILKLYVLPALAMAIIGATTLTNFGIVIRLRGLLTPILAPVIALGIITFLTHQKSTSKVTAEQALP